MILKNSLFFCIIIIFVSVRSFSQNQSEFESVNKHFEYLFYASVENEDSLESLNGFIEKYKNTAELKKVALTYAAGAKALEGKHAFWPFTKLARINESMEMFESVIQSDSLNLRTRFMRFSILHHLPGILGFNDEKADDINVIVELLLKMDYSIVEQQVQEGMVKFMIDSGRLTEVQIEELQNKFSFLAKNE